MAFDAHKNFAYSTVLTAPSPASSGTSLVVQGGDGAKFPAAPFNATVWPAGANPLTTNAEVVRVTAKSTDTFTITRAQESSSARSIGVGDQIANTVTNKVLTDIESAVGAASGAMTQIASNILSSPASTVDFSSIPSTYNHLMLIYILRTGKALEVNSFTSMRLNGDSSSIYAKEYGMGQGTSAVAGDDGPTATSWTGLFETGPNADGNSFAQGVVFFPFYSSTYQNKQMISISSMFAKTSDVTSWFSGTSSGLWKSTAAINEITMYSSDLSNNLATGSGGILYGIT